MNILLPIILLFSNLAFASELKIITPESFLNENSSIERKAIVDLMVNQFEGKRISQTDLDKIWNERDLRIKFNMLRVQIINQHLYVEVADNKFSDRYFHSYLNFFKQFVKRYKVKDVDFIIYIGDHIWQENGLEDKILSVPAFMMFKDNAYLYEKDMLLLPEAEILKSNWSKLLGNINDSSQSHNWDQKINKIFWRGINISHLDACDLKNFDKLPRLSLVMLSKLYPELIDASFSNYKSYSCNDKNKELSKILNILLGDKSYFVSPQNHLKYKYLISLDGASCSGTRVPWIMYSNSILLKQETSRMEWFYPALKPYVHYVPVNERLTDIFTQLDWMKNHDQELQKISENAHDFVANNLMPEHLEAHMAIILNEYSKIQQDKEIKPSLYPADEPWPLSYLLYILYHQIERRIVNWYYTWF